MPPQIEGMKLEAIGGLQQGQKISFDLKLNTSFTVGHLMCERSEENIKFVHDY